MTCQCVQVGAKHNAVMCFGPSVPDGFGCCYNPQSSQLGISVSAYNVCPETNSDGFANVLKQSLVDMGDLLMANPVDV